MPRGLTVNEKSVKKAMVDNAVQEKKTWAAADLMG